MAQSPSHTPSCSAVPVAHEKTRGSDREADSNDADCLYPTYVERPRLRRPSSAGAWPYFRDANYALCSAETGGVELVASHAQILSENEQGSLVLISRSESAHLESTSWQVMTEVASKPASCT